jgi:hypothetical protein
MELTMNDAVHHVRPQFHSKMDVSAALVAGWARVMMRTRQGKFADDLGVDAKTIRRWMTGEHLPEFHTALNSLVIDITALNEVFDLYGLELRPKAAKAGNDMLLLADTCHLSAQLAEVMADGVRNHHETLMLADTLTPMIPAYQAIVREAADLRAPAR